MSCKPLIPSIMRPVGSCCADGKQPAAGEGLLNLSAPKQATARARHLTPLSQGLIPDAPASKLDWGLLTSEQPPLSSHFLEPLGGIYSANEGEEVGKGQGLLVPSLGREPGGALAIGPPFPSRLLC